MIFLALLLSAQPGPAASPADMPPALVMVQWMGNETWNWTLTRRAGTPVYEAVGVHNQSGRSSNHVFELRSFDGKTVVLNRADAGLYTGTMSADGRTISGKTSFGSGVEGWKATFGSATIFATAQGRPSSPAAREAYEQGVSMRVKGDAKGAAAALDKAIRAEPGFSDAWRQRGLANSSLGRRKEALSDYSRAIQLDPGAAHAYNGRASVKIDLGDAAGAVADATRAIELEPTYSNAYLTRASARNEVKDDAGAVADADKGVELDPAFFPGLYNRSRYKAAAGDKAGAVADLRRFLQLAPNSSYAGPARQRLAQLGDVQPGEPSGAIAAAAPAAPAAIPRAAASSAAAPESLSISAAQFQQGKWTAADAVWKPLPAESMPDAGPGPRAALPELLDINHLTPANYQATITAAKEAMRLLMGPVSAEDQKRFDTKWAPLFEYPCQPVIEYFNKLNPLLNRFLTARAALNEAMFRFGNAWEEATAAAALPDEAGAEEAMQVCRVLRDNITGLHAQLSDLGRQIQALGEPPDPLAHKARARALHQESAQAVQALLKPSGQRPKAPGKYWVLSKLEADQKPLSSGPTDRFTFGTSEGYASGSFSHSEADPISKKVFKASIGGAVKWDRLPRVIPEASDGGLELPMTAEAQCTQREMTPNPTDPYEGFPCAWLLVEDDFGKWGPKADKSHVFAKFGEKSKASLKFRPRAEESVTLAIQVSASGGSAKYSYTYVARALSTDQVAEIQAKAAAEETKNADAQQQTAARQAAQQEDAEARMLAISLAQANQVYFQGQLDKMRADRAANPGQSDRYDYLILVMEANLQAERDSETTTATGEWTRTRTAYDDYNFARMAAQGQQTVGVTTQSLNAQASIPRLINMLPKELRFTELQNTQAAISQAIAAGNFAGVTKIVNDLSARVHAQAEKDSELYTRAANAANYVVGATEALKSGADKAMFVLSFVPGGAPIYTAYAGATGYVEGGPARAVREVLVTMTPVTMVLVNGYDGYQRRVKDEKTGKVTQGGVSGAVVEAGKAAITALAIQKAVGVALGAYFRGGKGNPEAPSVEQILAEAKFQSRMANGKAKVNLFKQRSEELAGAMRSNADPQTLAALRLKAEEAAKTIKCDYAAKMAINQSARQGDTATLNRYLTHERKFMNEVQENFQQNLARDGWAPQQMRQFSNSASSGKAGMDVDLGVVEPARFVRQGGKSVSNPAWQEWSRTVTQRNVQGQVMRRSVFEYQQAAQQQLDNAFGKVVGGPGRSTKEAYVNFTTSAHNESYTDTAWLGKKGTTHADFDMADPALAQQAADVTMFKIQHNPNAPKAAKPDPNRLKTTKDPIPDYLYFQEQCRTLVKDMNTKLVGSPGRTILPQAPLAKASKGVQQHVLEVRAVMDDFAGGRSGPIEADRKIRELTGGQGLPYVLKEFESVLVGGTR
jgi:tetratricopeptide (TPR) repeat protein